MSLRLFISILTILIQPRVLLASPDIPDDSVLHGTINVALGNKNGIVLLTDSMVTLSTGKQLPVSSQKLFKLDDHTVCSLAGFISAPAGSGESAIPDLNTNTVAIIREFARQSETQPPQTIAEKLRALAYIITQRLTTIASVRDVLSAGDSTDVYKFQLIVAGFDVDGEPKIGKIVLQTKRNVAALMSDVADFSILPVTKKLVWQLNGMPDVAEQILRHPESKPVDPALRAYAASLRRSGGSSLTVQQMVALAKRLACYTSKAHPEVGGPNQIALLRRGQKIDIKQASFTDQEDGLATFALVVNASFIHNMAKPKPDRTPMVLIRSEWIGTPIAVDYGYFIGSSFTETTVLYDGGPVSLGPSNHVSNSRLFIGPHAKRDDATVQYLINSFAWTSVDYGMPGYSF